MLLLRESLFVTFQGKSYCIWKLSDLLDCDKTVSLSVIVTFQGKSYCIWKLSDLLDCDKTVSFFLFGNVYKEHWKNHLGTVIGLLNPSMMDKAEKVFFGL